MLLQKREPLILNKIKYFCWIFILIFSFSVLGFEDTDEIDIFIYKAQEILKAMEAKSATKTAETIKSAEYELKMVEFTAKLQEILHMLKNQKFTEAVESIENLKLFISELSDANGIMRVENYSYHAMTENRVKVDVKFFNDSTKILENYFFKIKLLDESGKTISEKSFRTSKNFIRPFEKFEESFYFFNVHNIPKLKSVEFSL
ncbi:MAG: hypothetical protein WC002_01205 [Candidatus Muiribacteriota bacterium]